VKDQDVDEAHGKSEEVYSKDWVPHVVVDETAVSLLDGNCQIQISPSVLPNVHYV